MSKEPTATKIKLEAKPLNAKQRWNVFVVLLPWIIIIISGTFIAGMGIGNWQADNEAKAVQDAVSAQVEQLKANQ